MMMFMPVVFAGMLWAPSGLVIYWTAATCGRLASRI